MFRLSLRTFFGVSLVAAVACGFLGRVAAQHRFEQEFIKRHPDLSVERAGLIFM